MLVSKVRPLLDELESAGGGDGRGDPLKTAAALQRLVQAAHAQPLDLAGHLGDILRQTYFQTGVRPLRILRLAPELSLDCCSRLKLLFLFSPLFSFSFCSYSLLRHCHEAWDASSGEWDNVVGSSLKDIESGDPELQGAALRTLAVVPLAKMGGHLDRRRIDLPRWLAESPDAGVRRQVIAWLFKIAFFVC